jgi:hypothetical protein
MVASVCGLAGWDIFVAANSSPGDTISEVVLEVALRHPIVPFALGVLCGHWFWPQTPRDPFAEPPQSPG